ncbi:hypothetical protein AAVH_24505, partial [Aphelenchoides avenae]
AFDAFKPLSKVVVKADFSPNGWSSSFNEAFFIAATECGVRSMQFESEPLRAALAVDLLPALSFVFAKPTSGDDRSISGADCKVDGDDFLAQLIKKASGLDGRERIDFKFSVDALSKPIDPAGFEKYGRGDGRFWLVNDLENHINVEVQQTENRVEVHVFSAV